MHLLCRWLQDFQSRLPDYKTPNTLRHFRCTHMDSASFCIIVKKWILFKMSFSCFLVAMWAVSFFKIITSNCHLYLCPACSSLSQITNMASLFLVFFSVSVTAPYIGPAYLLHHFRWHWHLSCERTLFLNPLLNIPCSSSCAQDLSYAYC